MAKIIGCEYCNLACEWREQYDECTLCKRYINREKTACEEQCGQGCHPGCMGNACIGCSYNPESLY